MVRAGIKTGMLGLPSREHFLRSIGETGEPRAGAAAAAASAAAPRAECSSSRPPTCPSNVPTPSGLPEESAREHAEGFVNAATKLVHDLGKLYVGVEVPKSDFSVSSLWS